MNITKQHYHFQKRHTCYSQVKRIYERITISPERMGDKTKQAFNALGWYCPKCKKIIEDKVNKELD